MIDDPLTAMDADGWIYNVDTGEVLGRQDLQEFTVDSVEAADQVLELRSRIEGNIAGIDARIRAVTEQLQSLRKEQVRRLSWWDWRFSSQLIGFARTQLTEKSRTVLFGWGRVSFRKTKGNTEIVDMRAAVDYVRCWKPESVQVVEKVTLKDVLEARDEAQDATGEAESLPFVVSSGESENVKISTGIYLEEKQ